MKKLNALLLAAIAAMGLSACTFQEAWDKVKETANGAVDSVKDLFNKDEDGKDGDEKDEEENQGEGHNDPPHTHTFAGEWSSNETEHYHAATCEHTDERSDVGLHSFDATGHCSVCDYYNSSLDEGLVFTEEKLGYLSGKFYALNLVLEVSKDGAVCYSKDNSIALNNVRIDGSGYSTVVTYSYEDNLECKLSWKQAEYDKHGFGFMLPTLTVDGYDLQFQPDIAEYQGWYDAWFELDYDVMCYILTNEFNPKVSMFNMSIFNWGYEACFRDTYYAAASFKDIEGETKICISWFDNEDLRNGFNYVEWNYYFDRDSETGKINMISMDSEYIEWQTNVSFFVGTYWKEEYEADGLYAFYDGLYFYPDGVEKTVYVNDESVAYTEGFDENGQFALVGEAKYRGTGDGLLIETSQGAERYYPFFTTNLYGIQYTPYSSGENSIIYDTDYDTWEDNFFINGEPADEAGLTLYEGQVVYKFTKGSDVYLVNPNVAEDLVEVIKNGVSSYYFSEWLSYSFARTYCDEGNNIVVIDESLAATFNDAEFGQGEFVYDEEMERVGLHLSSEITIFEIDQNHGVYVFFGDDGESFGYLFAEEVAHSFFGEWSNGKSAFKASQEEDMIINLGGKSLTFKGFVALQNEMGEMVPALVAEGGNILTQEYIFALLGDSLQLYTEGSSGLVFVTSYVDSSLFEGVAGEYDFVGQYGIEKVIFTEDGRLKVDTSNSTHDGIELIEYDYYASVDYSGNLVLSFGYNEVSVGVVFDGNGHASIFNINYVQKEYFDAQGLYGVSADSMLSVVDTNIVYNGEKMYVSEVNGNVFTGTIGMDEATVTFGEGEVVVVIGENNPITLAKNATQLSSFKTEVHENVGELSRDIKVEEDGIYIRNSGDTEFTKVTDFEYVIDESGNVSIKFKNSFAYTFTISLVEGEVVITGESSLPPLPF